MIFVSHLGELKRYKRIALLLCGLLLVQLLIGAAIIYFIGMGQTRDFIQMISERAVDDIAYSNGTWNTARYDSDPEIPGNYRIYVITKDGFVIDRWRPIPGYLDTSDFRQMLSYSTPSTVHTITGQDWRIMSLPVESNGTVVGVVSVGRPLTAPAEPGVILVDQELRSAAETLLRNLVVRDSLLDASRINVRSIPFTVSFQIVDQYNRIQLKSDNTNSIDRLPNSIDPSYIADNLEEQSLKIIQSADGTEHFLVESTPLDDSHGAPIGTIIVARTIDPYIDLTRTFLELGGLAGIVLLAIGLLVFRRSGGLVLTADDSAVPLLQDGDIRSISFVKDKCLIVINDQEVPVSYATNQFYMCRALFSRPAKKWETDELVDYFGIEHSIDSWRKLYDAMASINKKCRTVMDANLIVASNKTYRLNPILLPVVSKTNGK